jgi:hypothetical protein
MAANPRGARPRSVWQICRRWLIRHASPGSESNFSLGIGDRVNYYLRLGRIAGGIMFKRLTASIRQRFAAFVHQISSRICLSLSDFGEGVRTIVSRLFPGTILLAV